MIRHTLLGLGLLLIASCTPKGEMFYEANAPAPAGKTTGGDSLTGTGFTLYVLENGLYTPGKLDKAPMPVGGIKAFNRALFSGLSYPPKAREAGIHGTVIVALMVDETGRMERAEVVKGIGGGCDEEALKAIKRAALPGFEPALQKGAPVKVKYEIPVKFSTP